tara:strand:- start:24 stop:677 length:654 start_codon:yes stop_codon:yes gene_type:complete
MSNKRLIVALDTNNISKAKEIASHLNPKHCMVKVGLELFISQRENILDYLSSKDFEIFLDLKLHDIPNTVSKALKAIQEFNVSMTTIHLKGGKDMVKAASESAGDIKLLGVSILTSLSEKEIENTYGVTFDNLFQRLLHIVNDSKIDGIVCSPHELKLLENINKIKVVPGIRNQVTGDDQRRVMSSSEAYALGADFIVVGRPITEALDIKKELAEYL